MRFVLVLSLALAASAGSSPAGDLIRRACLKAARDAATPELCGCIQKVADQRLKRAEQRLAASFFRDPHKAQVIRQSNRASHEVFWGKYKAWGEAAEEDCGS